MFTDITLAQQTSDYNNISDPQAKLVSLNQDGSAVLEVSAVTAELYVRNLAQANGKPVIIGTGSVYFLAGDYTAPRMECSLVRIVEAATSAE